jgi:hypothetical protein
VTFAIDDHRRGVQEQRDARLGCHPEQHRRPVVVVPRVIDVTDIDPKADLCG